MAETKTLAFNHKEVAEALIKQGDIHEGMWQIYIEFGIAAGNIQTGENEFSPSAIVPVKLIGLLRIDKMTPLGVDASKVNPKNKPKKK